MLSISDLSYRYTGSLSGASREALKGISLDVAQGEAFGFLGHNGAGKTTTIKCILGLIKPQNGKILIEGRDSREPCARAKLGYVPEQPYFYDHLTVFEAVEMYARLAGIERSKVRACATSSLERLGMGDRMASRMRSLSKGLTQRVAMAQAIAAGPAILILDEPFSGLDPIGRREFRELLLELKSQGTTILMSSHVLNDVERICDRASILVRGLLEGVFALKKLPELSSTSFELIIDSDTRDTSLLDPLATSSRRECGSTRLLFDRRKSAQEALAKSIEMGFEVLSFSSHGGTLEDLFSQLVAKDRGAE